MTHKAAASATFRAEIRCGDMGLVHHKTAGPMSSSAGKESVLQ
jgi:hypothetical protein